MGTVSTSDAHDAQFVAPEFWTALSEGISGLREVLEDSEGETEDTTTAHGNTPEQRDGAFCMGTVLLFPNIRMQEHHNRPVPSASESRKLLDLYRARVDTVYKVVHWPTTIALVEANRTERAPTFSNQALEYAIYFMALCTITDGEALELGLGDRSNLLRTYRLAAECFLAESDLLRHPSVTTLQAFVIYLIGLRTCLNSATTWTLVAVAVRATTAVGLGSEDIKSFSIFDLEIRRRLLYVVGILDTHSALDRGTIPILPRSAFHEPPSNINDSDMSPVNGIFAASRSEVTNMTHSAMIYEAMLCQRQMYEYHLAMKIPTTAGRRDCSSWQTLGFTLNRCVLEWAGPQPR
ncbi:hypothetical protein M3J09_003953 [Ascochyta lentis]